MFVILTYDIKGKRVKKVLNTCRKYLDHIQLSVFEGKMTDSKLNKQKQELKQIIVKVKDSICVYEIENTKYCRKNNIGIVNKSDEIMYIKN